VPAARADLVFDVPAARADLDFDVPAARADLGSFLALLLPAARADFGFSFFGAAEVSKAAVRVKARSNAKSFFIYLSFYYLGT
jgi:hypothetical protein